MKATIIEKPPGLAAQIYLLIMGLAAWFALVAQLYIYLENKAAPVPELLIRYFSFYTILTNILIAVCCTALLLKPGTVKFFSRPGILTGIAVNITIVGLVYNLILRFLWQPTGLQHAVDEILHLLIPLAFIFFWTTFVPKGTLKWSHIYPWMIYPLVYLAVVLVRGAMSGYYPYPFLDVVKLGYPTVFINSAGVTVAFILVSLLFVATDRGMVRNPVK